MRNELQKNRKLIAASVLALVAVVLAGRFLTVFVALSPSVRMREPLQRGGTESNVTKSTDLNAFDPTLKPDSLRFSEGTRYKGAGRNIFRVQTPASRTGSATGPSSSTSVQLVKLSLPTVGLRFFGFATVPGDRERIFLSSDADVFIGSEGEIVNRRYRILQITPTSVELEDLITGVRQKILLD